ncbi:hypothetical protein LIX60_31010 [Streptomyces sp. S07_1.15]|uniref:hypothetical protein n=1 Tax=Streptomyces sp. S07_1.15 TaxID=2873925 RepID=UPI001D1485F7|nr:hypothetical protein [Streptomyces sp. S07_1.15]MCC3655813.1 hypothetical protein [Streptomyces sp. S07_1.15]
MHITEHTFRMLRGLSDNALGEVFDLFRSLERDPYAAAQPAGIPDGRTFEAAFPHGILTVIVNDETGRITPISVVAL